MRFKVELLPLRRVRTHWLWVLVPTPLEIGVWPLATTLLLQALLLLPLALGPMH